MDGDATGRRPRESGSGLREEVIACRRGVVSARGLAAVLAPLVAGALLALASAGAGGCRSAGSVSTDVSADGSTAGSTADRTGAAGTGSPGADGERPDEQKTEGETTGGETAEARTVESTASAADVVSASATVKENIDRVGEIVTAYRQESLRSRGKPEGERARAQELFERMDRARRALAELYAGRELSAEEHFALCDALSKLGGAFQEKDPALSAAYHCQRYLELTKPDASSAKYLRALSVVGESRFGRGDIDGARKAFEEYLDRACGEYNPAPTSQVDRLKTAFCRRLLTYYLPIVYHRTGQVEKLQELPGRCEAYRLKSETALSRLWSYLLVDLWTKESLDDLHALASDLIGRSRWKPKSPDPLRQVAPLALSVESRLRLLAGEFYPIKKPYLDYDWNNPAASQLWRRQHLDGPIQMLCQTAPSIGVATWLGGRKPQVLPGNPAGIAEPVLIHYFRPDPVTMDEYAGALAAAAKRFEGRVQFIGIVPLSARCFDTEKGRMVGDLDRDGFIETLEGFVAARGIGYPIAVADANERSLLERAWVVRVYPTIILVDAKNRCVAFHTRPYFDRGWDRCFEKLTGK